MEWKYWRRVKYADKKPAFVYREIELPKGTKICKKMVTQFKNKVVLYAYFKKGKC